MPIYVAMLRGINVGGQKIIKMEDLRRSCETLGFRNVESYVQSGNLVFQTSKSSSSSLSQEISEVILGDFRSSVSVLVRTAREMGEVIMNNPFLKEENVDLSKLHVTFLSEPVSKVGPKNLGSLPAKPDQFRIGRQEIYVYCPAGYGKTKLSNNALEKELSTVATTRNWKTVNALFEIASRH